MRQAIVAAFLLSLFVIPLTAQAQTVMPTNGLTVEAAVPYDGGVVVLAKGGQTLYVYFMNATAHMLIYSLNLGSLFSGAPVASYGFAAYPFNGSLYVEIQPNYLIFYPSGFQPSGPSSLPLSYVVVFEGLKAVKEFYLYSSVLCLFSFGGLNALLFVGTYIYGGAVLVFPFYPYTNTTIVLNGENLTVPGKPIIILKVDEVIFIASIKTVLTPSRQGDVLYVMSYNGTRPVWVKEYTLNQTVYPVPITLGNFFTVVGGELFFVKDVTKGPSGLSVKVVGVSLYSGNIVSQIELNRVPSALLNIGNRLYLAFESKHYISVCEYANATLEPIIRLPVVYGNVTTTLEGVSGGEVKNLTVYAPLTRVYYSFGNYLLILNPGRNGTNVTVVNPVEVAHYFVDGIVVIANEALLVSKGGNLTLLPLNRYGFPVKEVNLGKSLEDSHWVKLFTTAEGYYVVIANSSDVAEYFVPFNITGSSVLNSTNVSIITAHRPNSLMPVVALTVGALVTVITVLVLSRRK